MDKSKIIYLGTIDPKVIELIETNFPEHQLFVADAELLNKTTQHYIEKEAKTVKNKALDEVRKDPKQIAVVMASASNIKAKLKDWFTLKELVNASGMNYSDAKETLDLLYSLSFLAKKPGNSKSELYKVVDQPEEKIAYLESVKKEKEEEIIEINSLIEMVAKGGFVIEEEVSKEKLEELGTKPFQEGIEFGKAMDEGNDIEEDNGEDIKTPKVPEETTEITENKE